MKNANRQNFKLDGILTARDTGQFLTPIGLLPHATADDASLPSVLVDTNHEFQCMVGFGGAFTESAAVTWFKLSAARREQVLKAYFDPENGHGYSFCRLHMGSCDFSLSNYSHVDTDDEELSSFSIERDRQALMPFIKAAQIVAGRPLQLLVSPWSPPAWMKTSGTMNHGGRLKPEFRNAWANYFVKFIKAYEAEEIPIWGVTIQNEPMATQRWDSCVYSAEEERDFVRDYLGPSLEKSGLGHIKIVIWDHNRDELVHRASVVYADPMAARFIWGAGFHWYVEDHFDHVQLAHDAWPDKHLIFTEGCQEGGPHTGEWSLGERYACSIINDLNRWTVGWIDWNLLLDEHGGPNHVGNYCSAAILADTQKDELLPQSSYAYLGHFSRYIKPGARRILCAANRQSLETTAFRNPDGTIACVVMNRSDEALKFQIKIGDSQGVALLPPHSIATYFS